ncbi:MAG TPA: hypothetical protein VL737_02885 [Candidatus Pristimantibacillus sp.]|nr:hypothetical protein [Candidatus Pristimantibacillus sp.]
MQMFRDKHHEVDPLWHVQLVLLGTIILQLALPDSLTLLPRYVLPALELVCMVALQFVTPKKAVFESSLRRVVILALIVAVLLANVSSLELVLTALFSTGKNDAPHLLLAAVDIYITNLVMFALFFWEMDNGGPGLRRGNGDETRDFLFPQQSAGHRKWFPTFFDYLYVSSTNATAFSPTDTLPLSRRAKFLMSIEALVSLLIVVLVTARAVNVL